VIRYPNDVGSKRPTPASFDVTPAQVADVARTLALVSRMLERSLDDMTLPQFRVLLLIARAPERANRLATQASVSRPSLTGVLDGLVGREWVRRLEVDGDRRGVSLEVTPAGRAALRHAQQAVRTRLDDVLELIAPERRAVAEEGLAALGEAMDLDLARRRAARSGSDA
jgi:DNA-binding MarR family transcriptional regulator